uniref:Uncharacterized protein n=1 Tax=Opuntia streptacantha TaxID=393608 RepID=A0A7C8ZAV3_OPUST
MAAQHKIYSNPSQGGFPRKQSFSTNHNANLQAGNSHNNTQAYYSNQHNPGNKNGLKTVGLDRRQLFCDHCKMAGHTIQRWTTCFQHCLHSFAFKLHIGT